MYLAMNMTSVECLHGLKGIDRILLDSSLDNLPCSLSSPYRLTTTGRRGGGSSSVAVTQILKYENLLCMSAKV